MSYHNTKSPFGESEPIYYEVSPKLKWVVRIVGTIAFVMILISLICCLVKANEYKLFYMLACNIFISSFIGIVNTWWYKREYLSQDKHWYMVTLAAVITWQCIATNIYVFNLRSTHKNDTTS